jgi:hypothetical protein
MSMQNPQSITVNDDSRLIPMWSIAAAMAAFVLIEYCVWMLLVPDERHPVPLGLRIYLTLSWGVVAALYFLMIGFVSKDAPRRAMSARFWMMLCFVMPCGIGAVLYFLLRSPQVSCCPACSTHIQNDFHFCPQCNYRLSASCGICFRSVRTSDRFCTGCGHELAHDHMPARLRALGE